MNLPHILQAVYAAPWAITREGWAAVHTIVKNHLTEPPSSILHPPSSSLKAGADPTTDFFGNPLPQMEVTDAGVVIIPVCGVLIQHAGLLEKMCGACSYDDIRRDLNSALGVRALSKIVLHIDSPGGTCNGCQETADLNARIRESGVRIEAVSDTQICSAAYALAAGANAIYCTSSSVVGSVGVILALLDQSLAYEMEGLKRDLITSGQFKGAGFPGTTLTEEQRADFQRTVDHYFKMFHDHVQRYRLVDDETMQGQCFIGQGAVDVGLVDELIEDVGIVSHVDSAELSDDDNV